MAAVGVRSDDLLHAMARHARLASTRQSYAFALMKGDGSVVSWGSKRLGGDSSSVQSELRKRHASFPFQHEKKPF